MKKALLTAVLAALVLAGCIGEGFDAGYERAKEIRGRYVADEQFMPETEKELGFLRSELSALKETSGNTALIDFLNIELAKVEMQLRNVRARNALQGMNLSDFDCAKLEEGLDHLRKAEESGNYALNLINDFQKSYPGEFLKANLERDRLSDYILSLGNTAAYVNNLKQLVC